MDDKEIFEKFKMNVAISNLKREYSEEQNENNINIFTIKSKKEWSVYAMKKRIIAGICASLILVSSVVLATNYSKIVSYFGLGGGIDSAAEHGYIENPNMDYVESDTTAINENLGILVDNVTASVKVEDFLMDDLNISTHFMFEFGNGINDVVNLDNLKNIELKDLIVTDENGKILYCMNKEMFENYCSENNLDYEFLEFNDNYYNCGLNSFIEYHYKEGGLAKLTYNMYSGNENFPKSKKLNFKFTKITLTENEKQGEDIESRNTVTLIGDWNINLDVPERMYNRKTISYKVISCENNDFEITNASVSETGFEIGIIISNMKRPEEPQILKDLREKYIEDKIDNEEYNRRMNEEGELRDAWEWYYENLSPITTYHKGYYEKPNIENVSYVENEKGQKYECTMSPSRRADGNFIDGNKFSFYETFGLTTYDATDKIKVRLLFKGESVIIELEKCK